MSAVTKIRQPGIKENEARVTIKPFPKFGFVEVPETGQVAGTGWIPDMPDLRDFTPDHPKLTPMIEKLGVPDVSKRMPKLATKIDLRPYCSPVENQGNLGSCTANAAVGVVEYFENRSFGKYINGSRLFVYKTARELMGLVGDTGAYLRTTMAALVMFGVPPETYWPYTDRQQPGVSGERTFDEEPTTFVYEIADDFEVPNYFCHDPYGTTLTPPNILNSVKTYLAAGIPSMFGFYVFPSYDKGDVKGAFPYPAPGERAFAGHAVAAVGYDDTLRITNKFSSKATTGALLIRNSWGTSWGDAGYGWLPYDYVTSQFAEDFWSVLGLKWINTGLFGLNV
ncbi:MAG: cysteine protease [Acidobacteriia bacterium]|nr:cysteine protease [Terriglobia bacterium]